MPNKIYIIDTNNTTTLTPNALTQLVPSQVKLPVSTQFPAITIVQSSTGQPVGISGYAQGYASVVHELGYYDAGSNYFNTNVSQLTLGQIFSTLSGNTSPIFGSVQINLTTLNLLISNNPTLYSNTTVFSSDIQSAMMTDLAILNVSQTSISYAKNVLNLNGISNSLAFYAAEFSIDPISVLTVYNSNDTSTTMGSTFNILNNALPAIKNATIHSIVNGKNNSLGLFQGFNSWNLYPSNMSGTDNLGSTIQTITLPGRGNNPGITNNSQEPINAFGYALSQISYLTQQSLTTLLSTISNITSIVPGQNLDALNALSIEASNSLALLPSVNTYTSSSPVSNSNVLSASANLQVAYTNYQQNPNNPVTSSILNIAISNFIQANTIDNNITDSVNNSFTQLSTNLSPVMTITDSGLNPFPPLTILQTSESLNFTSNVSNTSTQGAILNAVSLIASGNVNTIINGSTVPSLVTNPSLSMTAITGQTSGLNLVLPST